MDVVKVRREDEPEEYQRLEEYEGLADLFDAAEADDEDEDEDEDDEEEE
jgi:hypothetical protein